MRNSLLPWDSWMTVAATLALEALKLVVVQQQQRIDPVQLVRARRLQTQQVLQVGELLRRLMQYISANDSQLNATLQKCHKVV